MHPSLQKNLYLVKEHVGMFKAANQFDILDPASGEVLLLCREPHLGLFTKLFRFTDYKTLTPFDVHIQAPDGQTLVRVTRGISVWLSRVRVLDENNQPLGSFKQKFLSIGGKFAVLDDQDAPVCTLKGKWTSWDFRFLADDGTEYAHVTKKWAGLGKELFTTADTYVLQIAEDLPPDHPIRMLILAAVMCIDMVLKE